MPPEDVALIRQPARVGTGLRDHFMPD